MMLRLALLALAMSLSTPALAQDQGAYGPQIEPVTAEIAKAYPEVKSRWSKQRAQQWYAAQPWRIGANYLPANAINQLEMWQAETFDPVTIDKEFALAESIGFNVMRVYLHDLVWAQDPKGMYRRMDRFLEIADRHGIGIMFVFFDSCHFPDPKLGPQPLPLRGIHNSGWKQSPARDVMLAFGEGTLPQVEIDRLKGFVQGTMGRFKNDKRVVMWELFNEPGQGHGMQVRDKVAPLLYASWKWARAVKGVTQPLTSSHNGSQGAANRAIAMMNSDIISTHSYQDESWTAALLDGYDRPVAMTEYLARSAGRASRIDNILPLLKKRGVWAINWGFVAGKSGTIWPWNSRAMMKGRKYPEEWRLPELEVMPGEAIPEPDVWFHDLFRENGTPYDPKEIALIRQLTGEAVSTAKRK
jgi:hypothetical protein